MLLVAAGGSRRLGRPKQLVHLGGESLVRRATELALGVGAAWVGVVVGARAARVGAEIRGLPVSLIRNRRWREGLSASLRAGLTQVPRSAAYLLVMTVDQWQLTSDDLACLLRRVRPAAPVAARYLGRLGVPAVFPRGWFGRLASLRGDAGAAALLRATEIEGVALERAAADLDVPGDLEAARRAGRYRRHAP